MIDDDGATAHDRAVVRYTKDEAAPAREPVAEETPVAIAYNGISHAVMLATPSDLEDFVIGFSLSEGIVGSLAEIHDVEVSASPGGTTLDVTIGNGPFARLKERRRTLAGRTGCGLCGIESLDQALRPLLPVTSSLTIEPATLYTLARNLAASQPLHARTGTTHAAGWGRADGSVDLVREDVGRHNALDKLIGALVLRRIDTTDGIALLTSRASSEMVQKAATVGMPMLAALSAPTALAVRIAEETGVTLVAWLRADRFSVYTHGHRVREAALENTR